MIAKLKAAYIKFVATKTGAIVQRVVVAGVTAFGATFIPQALEVHLFTVPGFFNLALWHVVVGAALYAAGTAVLALVQSIVTTMLTGAPQLSTKARANFKARQAAIRG